MVHGKLFRGGGLVLAWLLVITNSHSQTVGVLREVWEGIGGVAVADLTGSPNYPDHPTSTNFVTDLFEAPTDVLESYGQRMHGYVIPPLTGNYTFWIASDDGGALYLSTDENPVNARVVATVNGWTSPRQWEWEANQKSAPIALTAGKAYYISALMKEGGGGDNLAVRWLWPNGTDQAPIVGTNLLPFGVSFAPPAIAEQPATTSAVEGSTAQFTVRLSTVGPATFQWRRNGSPLAAPSAPTLSYGPVALADEGARFSVLISNSQGSTTSAEAVLQVSPDVTRPTLVSAMNIGVDLLRLRFSEPLAPAGATNPANYAVSSARTVRSARFGADATIVELGVDPLNYGASYTLTVNAVTDRALTPNAILPNSRLTLTALEYAPGTVGAPALAGAVVPANGGADVTGSGDLGGRADRFQFAYQPVTGDFDRRVRVASFSPADPFALAALMARASLESNSVFAAAVTTPAQVGAFMLSRATTGETAVRSGRVPANYPDTWLRLARSGNTFRAYAGFDGAAWVELGSVSLTLPATVLVGFSVSSHDDTRTGTATFREASVVTAPTVIAASALPRRGETLGPSSRHTPLVISEIMYHPRERADGRDGEFVEIYNADLIDQNLTGYRLAGSVDYAFPDGYLLPAGGFAVIARSPADLAVIHGLTSALGPFDGTNNLPNQRGTVRLRDPRGAILLEVNYASDDPWPVAADGGGHSLVLARPSYGEGDPRAWLPSERIGGSPGRSESVSANPLAGVLINEILAHTDLPQLDFVELYNHNNQTVDLSGCIVTDDPRTNRFRLPNGSVVSARGFLGLDETQLGFRLNAAGETVFLLNPDGTRVLDAIRFSGQENGVSSGRFPDGTPEWRRLKTVTLGAENTAFRVSDVVINEILYAPISGNDDDEFVELYNRSSAPVDLGEWSFTDGIDFRFPKGTTLAAGAYCVVTRQREHFLATHPGLTAGVVYGNYNGTLSDGGERLALAMPDWITVTNAFGLTETNRIAIEVDEVTYGTGGRWGQWSDGLGSSLELVDANSDHRQASNWADSDESGKAPWTTVEFTGTVDNVADGVSSSRLHLLAQGPGEYLIDDVQVLGPDGVNRVANGDFASGITGWTPQGNHRNSSYAATDGVNGGGALRVRALGRGDTSVNRVRTAISPALALNSVATLRAKVRWLRGWPEFLLRTLGSGIEAPGRLLVPDNLGTPGAPNGRAIANTGPAIFDVRHQPVVPRDREAVVVTARVTDPDGVQDFRLRYHVDGVSTVSNVTLRDDGTAGDSVAGDGVYSGTIPGRPAGTLIDFRLEATDARADGPATSLFPADAPTHEALIRWGEERPFGNLGVYRLWQRQADYNRLRSREALANDNLDCTFVYGDERVIYNAEMRGKGSPWHGGSVGGDYIFSMPEGDRLLGARDMAVVTLGNLGSDPSAQREQAAFWIGRQMGVPSLQRRHIHFYENGGFKGLYEDSEEPNGLFVDAHYPDGQNGDLYKIEDWFEFNDDGSGFVFNRDATLERFTTAGGDLKLARYRWAWRKRAVQESANDYTEFKRLVSAINGPANTYAPLFDNLTDVDEWMHAFALQHVVGNWDAYGYGRGKNSYLYLPSGGRWQIIPWDIDFVLGSGGDGPTSDVFGSVDPRISVLWDTPVFRRMYWRAFQDAIDGPLRAEAIGPVLDGRYAALTDNGFSVESTAAIKSYVSQRRQFLIDRIAGEDVAALEITSNNGANFTTNRALVTLTGKAPIAVATITVNGVAFPVTWTTVNTWSLALPLGATTNNLVLAGLDRRGRPIPGLSDSVTIRYTGELARPEDTLVFNEVMYDPPIPGAGYVELYNRSATAAFDLSGWRLEGVDFTFPAGTVMRGGAYLVVAADALAFRTAYGTGVLPVGVFAGQLQNNGERLRLVRPGATPDLDRVIDEIRYDNVLPWPTEAHGRGPALQLIDPLQDNRRVANWSVTATNDPSAATPGRGNAVATTLTPFPALWLNEVQPQNTGPLADRQGDRDPWMEIYNDSTSPVDLSSLFLSSTYTNLTEWAFPPGTSIGAKQYLIVWCDGEPSETTATELHTSFRLDPARGGLALSRIQNGTPAVLDYLEYRDIGPGKAWGSFPDADPLARRYLHVPTPGAANSGGAPTLLVFVNEWMADNRTAVLDPADGDPDDWFELYNGGNAVADLSEYTLTDTLTVPAKFRLPHGTTIPAGGFLRVWADEETGQSTNGQVHVNFKLSGTGEAIGLFAPDGARVDAITFGAQSNNVAQGRFPDGGPAPFAFLDYPTPTAPNVLGTANQPPSLGALPPMAIDEGGRVTFRATATDPDAAQHLRFSLVGAPAGATFDETTGDFAWTTTEADGPGEFTFSVRVTDDGQPPRTDTENVTITVREVNQPPTLEAVANQRVDELQTLSLTVRAADPDLPAQRLSFALEDGAPSGATLNPVSGEFTWTPTEDQGPGTYPITVRATDDRTPALAAARTFQVVVNEVDNPPVFEPVGLQSATENARFRLTVVARDPDLGGGALQYTLETAPQGVVIDATSGVLEWTPIESAGPGTYNVVVRATEPGGLSATVSFSIVVEEANQAPTLDSLADQEVIEGTEIRFRAVGRDADLPAQKLTYRLEPGAPAEASLHPDTGEFVWSIPADAGGSTNTITVSVTDDAVPAASASRSFTVMVRPRLRVVINELMHSPKAAQAEFVELFNGSAVTTWDLSGWRLTGFEFVFPSGTILGPTNYLVVARNLTAYRAAYGTTSRALGNASAFPAADPARVQLQRSTAPTSGWETIDEVSFSRQAPWPAAANGSGASLQLVDAQQDRRRVANWAALAGATTNAPVAVVGFTNGWRYKQDGAAPAGWRESAFNDSAWPAGPGLLYVEDAALPAPKNTALTRTDGRMTYYFRTRFAFAGNPDGASLVLNTIVDDGFVLYLNGREIYRLGLDPAATVDDSTAANRTVSDALLEGPVTIPVTNLVAGTNVLAVEVHQANGTSSDIVWGATVDVLEVKRESSTPGYANSVRATLPPFPDVWINEVVPRNTAGPVDVAGDRDPWMELRQGSGGSADLAGWWLTDDLANLTRWPLPSGAALGAGTYRVVWLDGEPNEGTASEWHAGFRPAFPSGVVALVRTQLGVPTVVDYLRYTVTVGDEAFGILAESDPLLSGRLPAPTPGVANQGNRPPVLADVGDLKAQVGRELVVQLSAQDPDLAQRLTFALTAGAPAGARVDGASGRFAWTPVAGQEGDHVVGVLVSDDGVPSLGDQGSFTIRVTPAAVAEVRLAPPVFVNREQLQLAWSAGAGTAYAVEGAPSPAGPWVVVGPRVVADSGVASVTVTISSATLSGFYRVVVVP